MYKSILNVTKSMLSSTWITMLIAIIGFIVAQKFDYGEYIGIFVFGVMFILLFFYAPKVFGQDVFENIYLVAKNKIKTIKRA